jgi:hypothetical protein
VRSHTAVEAVQPQLVWYLSVVVHLVANFVILATLDTCSRRVIAAESLFYPRAFGIVADPLDS